MKRLMTWALVLCFLSACNPRPVARISATLEGAADSVVVLQKLNYNRLVTVDSIRLDKSGHFNYKVKLTGNEPYFYYLALGGKPVASMVLLPSDQVTVTVPAEGGFEIEGSEESALLKELNDAYAEAAGRMQALAASLDDAGSDAEVQALNREMSRLYVDYKRQVIRHIVSHPHSITSAVALFQRFGENLPVFAQETDAVLFRAVQDSLSGIYPKSEYLTAIRDELDVRSKDLELYTRIGDASVISFPDIALPDVEGNVRSLSDLEGKVILLSFWSVSQDAQKLFNVDLVELYRKYHAQGLEIYQVSLDIDKPSWASIVRSQQLPWISVNDGYGAQSPSVAAYNVGQVPSLFVIGRDGDIAGRDIFDKDALEQLVRKLL